jgi:hypothetical protein
MCGLQQSRLVDHPAMPQPVPLDQQVPLQRYIHGNVQEYPGVWNNKLFYSLVTCNSDSSPLLPETNGTSSMCAGAYNSLQALWFGDDLGAAPGHGIICNFWVEQAMIEGVPMSTPRPLSLTFYTNPCGIYAGCDYDSFS